MDNDDAVQRVYIMFAVENSHFAVIYKICLTILYIKISSEIY